MQLARLLSGTTLATRRIGAAALKLTWFRSASAAVRNPTSAQPPHHSRGLPTPAAASTPTALSIGQAAARQPQLGGVGAQKTKPKRQQKRMQPQQATVGQQPQAQGLSQSPQQPLKQQKRKGQEQEPPVQALEGQKQQEQQERTPQKKQRLQNQAGQPQVEALQQQQVEEQQQQAQQQGQQGQAVQQQQAQQQQQQQQQQVEQRLPAQAQQPAQQPQQQRQQQQGQQQRGGQQGQQQGQQPKQQKQKGKKKDWTDPLNVTIREINVSAKSGDLARALAAFRLAQQQSLRLPINNYNTLLYLAVGGDAWEVLARGGDPDALAADNVRTATTAPAPAMAPPASPVFLPAPRGWASGDGAAAAGGSQGGLVASEPAGDGEVVEAVGAVGAVGEEEDAGPPVVPVTLSREERVALAEELWVAMQAVGHKPDGGSYLALARMEGLQRNPEKALQWAKAAHTARCSPTIRYFQPALVGYCMHRDYRSVLEVHEAIKTLDLDLTEYEFARLLEGLMSDTRASWPLLQALFLRMGRELEGLSRSTIDLISAYFSSPHSHAALTTQTATSEETPAWGLQTVQVDSSGVCAEAGAPLQVVDLEEEEWVSFANGVADLARKNEASRGAALQGGKTQFDWYIEWFEHNGPYDILIDGANVALFGQNHEAGGFNWAQVERMVTALKTAHPGKKVLLMLHKRRIQDVHASAPRVKAFLDQLREEKAFYSTPHGSNDDWYWMYAAVRARGAGLLISNDELRDHIFSLLRPKHFLKWKARHIAHYQYAEATGGDFVLTYPPAYTTCVQQLANGAWMFPCATDNTWLCVRPASDL